MDDVLEAEILRAGRAARRLFVRPAPITPSSKTAYGAGYAIWRTAADGQQIAETHPLHPHALAVSASSYAGIYSETIARYSAAHEAGISVSTVRDTDDACLALNTAAANLAMLGARCIAFPEGENAWVVVPTDPATLRCVTGDNVEDILIDRALADGVYATGPVNDDLFCDSTQFIDVIIRLVHEHCQIRHRMSLAEAQDIGIRRRWLTCRVRRRNGSVPEIVGNLQLDVAS